MNVSANNVVDDFFNFTNWNLEIDATKPYVNITSISTFAGSNIVYLNATSTDSHLHMCKYSVYNSTWGIDGFNNNVSYICNALIQINVSSGYGEYTLMDFANDTVSNENSTSKNFTIIPPLPGGSGGGGTIIVGNLSWNVQTETGGDRYQFNMLRGTSRSRDLLYQNLGSEKLIISLTCESVSGPEDLCNYLSYEYLDFDLPVETGVKVPIAFTIVLPEDIEKGDYVINLISTDDKSNQIALSTEVNVETFNELVKITTKLTLSKSIGQIKIPYLAIFFFSTLILFVIFSYIYKGAKLKANLGFALITGIFLSMLLIIFI